MTKRDKNGRFTFDEHKQWYLKYKEDGSQYKVGYYDIEFSDLAANFGYVTCWTIKARDKNEYRTYHLMEKDIQSGKLDRDLIQKFGEVSLGYDLLIGFYSSMADMPYLRGQALHYGLEFPKYRSINHLDVYFAVRGKVASHSKSLKTLCEYLNIKTKKIDLSANEWLMAKLAKKEVMPKLIKRNQADCAMLEELHKKFESYVKFNRNWI